MHTVNSPVSSAPPRYVPDGDRTPPPAVPPSRLATAGAVLVPAAVMLGIALWGLNRGTMWRDESATFQIARRSVPDIWRLLGELDAVHGLYYLLMHAVLAVRADEVMLRLPSALGAACSAGLVAAIGCRLARPRVGLWAGLLYAATPFTSFYAQEGRSYALVAAGAALATWCLVSAVEHDSAGRWAGYAAAVAGTALLHEFAVLMLVAHGATVLAAGSRPGAWRRWATAAGAAVVPLVPLALVSSRQGGQTSWIQEPGVEELRLLALQFAGPDVRVLTVAALLAGLAALSPLRRTGRVGLTAVALPLVVLPVAVLFAVSLVKPLFVDRYLLFAFAGFPLLVAAGLERLLGTLRSAPWRPVVTAAGVVAVAAAFWCQLPFQERERGKDGRVDDLREVAAYVAAQTRPNDAVLFVPSYQRHIFLTYDREFAGRRDIALEAGAAASGTFYGQEFDAARIGARIGAERRIWVVAWPSAWSEQWFDEDPKITALRKGFELARSTRLKSGLVQLYVRE
ncbi:glycosyltransferase family 39 protein [Streptomyces sp. NPDC057027]|uniref:glycosyltransferase family 39 protein n=1 Tax=Streptomyces sp. NPDC057027 TaxID=3346004 RepID=UPI003640F1A5